MWCGVVCSVSMMICGVVECLACRDGIWFRVHCKEVLCVLVYNVGKFRVVQCRERQYDTIRCSVVCV